MDIDNDAQKIDKRSREYRNRQESDRADAIRPHHTPQQARYNAQEELARADALAREIRDSRPPESDEITNIFNISPSDAPPGWTYEGKRVSVGGKSDGHLGDDNIRAAYQVGWRPVPASRHPNTVPIGFTGDTIIKAGLMLMERPTTLVDEAKNRDLLTAKRVVHDKKATLGMPSGGTFTERSDSRYTARVSYGAPTPISAE